MSGSMGTFFYILGIVSRKLQSVLKKYKIQYQQLNFSHIVNIIRIHYHIHSREIEALYLFIGKEMGYCLKY